MPRNTAEKDYIAYLENYKATEIVFDEGAFTHLAESLMLSDKKAFTIVSGGRNSSNSSGAHQAFLNMSLGFDFDTPVYFGVPAEPDVECVRDIVKHLETEKPEAVVALGGGSVMDATKAAYLSWQTGLDVTELFGVNAASAKFPGRKFERVICIPTTSGTGSEVTPYANIVDKERNLKMLICEQQIVPELALVDATFSHSMPKELTAATALDAFTHAVESLLNCKAENADPLTEEWAMEAIKLIRYALPRLLHEDNINGAIEREMLSAAATLAGMCIKERPTALPHLCSYSLWGKVPHGVAVAMFLPHFMRYYLAGSDKDVTAQIMKLATIFPLDNPEHIIDAVERFILTNSPVQKLSEIEGYDKETVAKIAADAVKNPAKLASAPRAVEDPKKTLTEILSKTL